MTKISANISNIKKESKKFSIGFLVIILLAGALFYYTRFYVIIRFNELGPLVKNMSAYYNGFKIGKITKIEPDSDFKHTLVQVDLSQKNIRIPQNTVVYVERFPNGELYLQFVYPQSPSLSTLKSGDLLEGVAPYNLEQFMMGQSISGMSDLVSLHIIKALNSADAANQEMEVFFKITTKLIKANGRGIKTSVNNAALMTENLAEMAKNLNQATKKLNDSFDGSFLKDSTVNIKETTDNIKDTTENISKATKDFDKTMKKLDDTMNEINATAQNLNSITTGVNETLGKKFGGMRLMFGTTVQQKNREKSCSK